QAGAVEGRLRADVSAYPARQVLPLHGHRGVARHRSERRTAALFASQTDAGSDRRRAHEPRPDRLEIANEDPDNPDPPGSDMFYTSLTNVGDLWSFGSIRL